MIQAYMMAYKGADKEKTAIEMVPYSSRYQEAYRRIYNDCYHEMRKALNIEPFDFIQDDSFFDKGMDQVYLLLDGDRIIGSVALKGNEIDDLIVNRKYQGRGYGRQILLWALEHMRSDPIFLRVAAWNERAIRLYSRAGFEIVETTGRETKT